MADVLVGLPSDQWISQTYRFSSTLDSIDDQQTGDREGDIVGAPNASFPGQTLPAFYSKFAAGATNTSGDLAFRARLSLDKGSNLSYSGSVYVGIDVNGDGALDIFAGYTHQGSAQEVGLYRPGTGANISPSTTTIDNSHPVWSVTTGFASYFSYANVVIGAGGNDPNGFSNDLDGNGNDMFLSFQVPFQEIVNALGNGLTSASSLGLTLATSQQANSINQDINGIAGSVNSTSTYQTLGVISTPRSASGISGDINFVTTSTLAALDNTGATGAISQQKGAITFTTGEGTMNINRAVNQDITLTLESITPRSTQGTGNFTTTGTGTSVTASKILVTNAPAVSNQLIDTGLFYNGADYLVYDGTNHYLRPLSYGSDTNTATVAGGATMGAVTGKDVQITGAITAQTTLAIDSVKIGGSLNMTLASSQTLTTNGILKTGGNSSQISGGAGIQGALNHELVVRADTAGDTLTIGNAILANGSNALTKSGSGNVILTATNSYTGPTSINAGTLTVNGSIATTSSVAIENTGILAGTGTVGGPVTVKAGGAIAPGSGAPGTGVLTLNGSLTFLSGSGASLQLSANGYIGSAVNTDGSLNTTFLNNLANRSIGTTDRINGGGSINLIAGGSLDASSVGGYTPKQGDAFDLLDWSTALNLNGFTFGAGLRTGGAIDNALYDLKLPDLSGTGLFWNVSQFSSGGIIVVVPEPGRAMLLILGGTALLLRRRRGTS